jgi:4-aminobutyrate aminotransferase
VAGGLADNAAEVGRHVMRRARGLAERYAVVGDVRGLGLFIGVEFVTDRVSKEPAVDLVDRIVRRAFHNGLLLLSCGRSTIRLMPPLVVTPAEADEAMDILDASIAECL